MLVSHVHIKDLALTQTYNLGRCKIHCSFIKLIMLHVSIFFAELLGLVIKNNC